MTHNIGATLPLRWIACLAFCIGLLYAQPAPRYAWKAGKRVAMVASSTGTSYYSDGPYFSRHMRVHVTAEYPVTYAFIPARWADDFKKRPTRISLPVNTVRESCPTLSVKTNDRVCDLGNDRDGYYLALYYAPYSDADGAKAMLSIGRALAGNPLPLIEGLLNAPGDNKIVVSVYSWDCVANCRIRR